MRQKKNRSRRPEYKQKKKKKNNHKYRFRIKAATSGKRKYEPLIISVVSLLFVILLAVGIGTANKTKAVDAKPVSTVISVSTISDFTSTKLNTEETVPSVEDKAPKIEQEESEAKEIEVNEQDAGALESKEPGKSLDVDLSQFELVGFASGIYYSKFNDKVAEYAKKNLTKNGQKVFLLYTYGAKRDSYLKDISAAVASKAGEIIGSYGCAGFDTFGPFKLVGGLQKGHPDVDEIAGAVKFFEGL